MRSIYDKDKNSHKCWNVKNFKKNRILDILESEELFLGEEKNIKKNE